MISGPKKMQNRRHFHPIMPRIKTMTARENILERLQKAAAGRKQSEPEPDLKAPVYLDTSLDPADWFQQNLEKVAGEVIRVPDLKEAVLQVNKLTNQEKWTSVFCRDPFLAEALKNVVKIKQDETEFLTLQTSITGCEYLVAHLGSALICSAQASGRRMPVYAENHIIIAHRGQLVKYLDEALTRLKEKYGNNMPSSITNITGPSRTADIEKTLVKGMHGPRRFIVILCDTPY